MEEPEQKEKELKQSLSPIAGIKADTYGQEVVSESPVPLSQETSSSIQAPVVDGESERNLSNDSVDALSEWGATSSSSVEIPDKHFFRIGEVSEIVGVKPYVLRYWESEFSILSPQKSPTGQRVFRRADVETLLLIKHLLYSEKYSIQGAKKKIQEVRKTGGLRVLKEEKLHGGPDRVRQREQDSRTLEKVEDLLRTIRRPMSELFKL